jgi:hypothetical protein
MDYIIDPMWFYWLQIVDSIQGLFCITAIISGIISLIALAFYIASVIEGCTYEEDDRKRLKGLLKPFAICFIIAITAAAFIPSKQTLIEMEIAKHATYSNVESIKEQIKDAADYILDRLEGKENK